MAAGEKDFDFETISVVVYCLLENGHTLGPKYFQMMADIHGTRTQSSFEHQFRKVKQRAKEIQAAVKAGTLKTAPGSSASNVSNGKKGGAKRGRKGTAEVEDDEEIRSEHLSKKIKVKAEKSDESQDDLAAYLE